jgi:N-acetylmuramoyl-L-alanine amidase
MSGKELLRRSQLAAFAILLGAFCHTHSWAASATRVEVRQGRGKLAIAVVTDGARKLGCKSFTLDDPPRLIFDIGDAILASDQPATLAASGAGIRQARLGQFTPDTVRLVLDLESSPPAQWKQLAGDKPGEMLIVFETSREPVTLQPPAVKPAEKGAVVVLAGAAALQRHEGTLSDPPRIYADLTGAQLAEPYYRKEFAGGPIREVRTAPQPESDGKPVCRIVVELRESAPHAFSSDGADLVLAIGPETWALPPPAYRPAGRLKGKRIVVDPGHGGHDIGAPAKPGSPPDTPYEKDVVLDIGTRLARLLRAEGASVIMTRDDDTFVTLQGRAAIANKLAADTFVSIHCNSCPTPDTLCGTSVYYDHENSIELAELVQKEMIADLATEDNGIRNANFAVIRRTTGPGVLVETGFINHKGDREKLTNPNFRERTARAILRGVIRFLSQPPAKSNADE